MHDEALREHLRKLLGWQDAHVGFDAAVQGIPASLQGKRPHELPYSAWELIEHLRITQKDVLDFCVSTDYQEMRWPDDYWPPDGSPSAGAWDASISAFLADRAALQQLADSVDLLAAVPNGTGQTYLRELLLVADHNAYHVGQLITVRRLLGAWDG